MLYGCQVDVRKRCQRVARRLARGEPYVQAIGDMVDVGSLGGNLVFEGGRGSLGDRLHIHCYLLPFEIQKVIDAGRMPKSVSGDFIQKCLTTAWGVTTLLGTPGQVLMGRSYWAAFLRAVHMQWADLIAVGARYAYFSMPPTELWMAITTISVALGQLGVSNERLMRGFTREGLAPFTQYFMQS
jgi:hypothetical protein